MFATNVPWPKNHRVHFPHKKDLKSKTGRDTEQARHGVNENRLTIDERLKERKEEDVNPLNLSKGTDRIQFQIEGHEGPQTYIFGFDTGHG